MPKGEEERRKSETKSSGSSEAQVSKPERRISVESAAASTLEDKDRKESISLAQLDCSSLSVESIVTEETEKLSEAKPMTIPKSETTESQLLVCGLLQPPASGKTRVSPVKEFFSNIAQKLHLSTSQKKSPTKPSPEIEEYIPGQELKQECIVKLPPKDKKTQTMKLTEARNITPKKRAASFLSPETCEDNETSASQSTTGDERDLITPSPTLRLDASKMTLAITGFEPVKPEPGPFQKFRKLMGFEKEEKASTSDQTSTKCEHNTKAQSTQTINMPMSAILTESVLVLKEQDRGWASEISTSDSVDYPESSRGTSENSMDCSSSMNADTSSSSPPKSPMEVGAVASLTGSEKSLQLKFERTNIVEKPDVKKMPNPVIEMLKLEKSEHIEDEATSTSPRKKDSEDGFSEPLPSFQKQTTVSETFSTARSQKAGMNVKETEKANSTITETTARGLLAHISKSSDEGMNVEESTEANIVAESNVKDILVLSSKSLTKVTKFEEMFQDENESSSSVSQSDVKALSVSDGRCKEINVQETSEKVKMVAQTDEKDLLISKSQSEKNNVERIFEEPETTDAQLDKKDVSSSKSLDEKMNVKETFEEAKKIVAQSDKDFSASKGQGKEMNADEISGQDESMVAQLEKKEFSISKDQENKMKVIDTSVESESIATQSNKTNLSFPKIQDKDVKVEEISKETDTTVSETEKKDLSMNVEENSKKSTDTAAGISEPNLISLSTSKGLDEEKYIKKSSKEACDLVSKPDEKDISITSSSKKMNVEDVSKEVESRNAELDKKNLSIKVMDVEESSDSASELAQSNSLFSISKSSDDSENVKTTSQEVSEACSSVSQSIEHDSLLSTSHSKGMNVDNFPEEVSNMVCKAEDKDFSVPQNKGEETTVKKSSKETDEVVCKVSQPNVSFSTSKYPEELKANEPFKEDGEAAGKIVSSISTSLDEEMEVKSTAKEVNDEIDKVSTLTSQRKEMLAEDIFKEASDTTGRVAQLITLFSSSTNPEEELKVLETSTKTSEDNGGDAQSDISFSTSKDEEMNIEDAMQESSKTCTEVTESDIKDILAVSTSLDDEEMDTS